MFVIGFATVAGATPIAVPLPRLVFKLDVGVSPQHLPRHEYLPAMAKISGEVGNTDGAHPPALREAVFDVDKDVKINLKWLPSCKAGQRDLRDPEAARRVCRGARLGGGKMRFEIAFPEQPPITVTSPIAIFNGGEKGGKVKLLIHTFITAPVPAAVVTDVTITRKGSGLHSVAKVPVVAGGSGTVTDFRFKIGRTYTYKGKRVGYFEAKCPDGKFKMNVPKILFKNEAKTPGVAPTTTLKGSLLVPCTPRG